MRIETVMGAFLICLPGLALADQKAQPENQPTQQEQQNQPEQNQQTQQGRKESDENVRRYLPGDAKLVGMSRVTEVRAFPEQEGKQASSKIEKEDVVGAAALDRVWTTKMPYRQTVKHFDQSFKSEGAEPLAKTTTQSATAWNVKMPDGHIANVVVRNTSPTTIESVQLAGAEGTIPPANPQNQGGNRPGSSPQNQGTNR